MTMKIQDNETYPFPVEITFRRTGRSVSLRISREKTVKVSVPYHGKKEWAYRFIDEKMDWIKEHLARIPEPVFYRYEEGEIHYFLGKPCPVYFISGKKNLLSFDGKEIHITMTDRTKDRKALYERLMKEELQKVIARLLDRWMSPMNAFPSSFSIRKVKSRWGSCNLKTGALTFALDLVTKPEEEIESVVVHELNHLLESGHTVRFHELMKHWLPDYRERRKKLNEFPREFM